MRHFIILVRDFPRIARHEIDQGSMTQETVLLISCVRSSLFTSYGIRRDVKVTVYPFGTSERFIVIEGERLRYMGPDERSISILLSMSADKLGSPGISDVEVSSPGITVVRKNSALLFGPDENLLLLLQSPEGSDLRGLRFTGNTAYLCALDGEWFFEGTRSLLSGSTRIPIPVQSTGQPWRAILLINNEIDIQLREHQTA